MIVAINFTLYWYWTFNTFFFKIDWQLFSFEEANIQSICLCDWFARPLWRIIVRNFFTFTNMRLFYPHVFASLCLHAFVCSSRDLFVRRKVWDGHVIVDHKFLLAWWEGLKMGMGIIFFTPIVISRSSQIGLKRIVY